MAIACARFGYVWTVCLVGPFALAACGEDDGARPEEPPCPMGEVRIRTPEDVEAIAHCEELDEVSVELETPGGLLLPALERVNALHLFQNVTAVEVPALVSCTSLYAQSRELSLIAAPALRSGGVYLSGGVPGTSLELPSLEVSSDLQLHGDWAVLSLPQLRSVEQELDVAGVDTLHAPLLREVGNLVLAEATGEKGLGSLSLPALEVVSGSIVMTNRGDGTIFPEHRIASVDLPALRQAGDVVFVGGEVLPSLSLPALERVEGGLSVAALPALVSLDMPRLTYVGAHFGVTGNESLPACEVDAVVQQLVAAGAPCTFDVAGNGPECQ